MKQDYIPSLGRFGATRHYDRALALMTREKRWRSALLERLEGLGDGTGIDIGCGTGSLAIAIKAAHPRARVIGLDPDSDALAIAQTKAAKCGADVEWMQTMATGASRYWARVPPISSCRASYSTNVRPT